MGLCYVILYGWFGCDFATHVDNSGFLGCFAGFGGGVSMEIRFPTQRLV